MRQVILANTCKQRKVKFGVRCVYMGMYLSALFLTFQIEFFNQTKIILSVYQQKLLISMRFQHNQNYN